MNQKFTTSEQVSWACRNAKFGYLEGNAKVFVKLQNACIRITDARTENGIFEVRSVAGNWIPAKVENVYTLTMRRPD